MAGEKTLGCLHHHYYYMKCNANVSVNHRFICVFTDSADTGARQNANTGWPDYVVTHLCANRDGRLYVIATLANEAK